MEFYATEDLRTDELHLLLDHIEPENPEKQWVPAYCFYICSPQGVKMGVCDLRVGHNENTYYGGNIGYAVWPEYRGHHYAAKACRLLFALARKHDLKQLYITCSPENVASRRTCERVGGVLVEIAELPPENEMFEEGERTKCIYRVEL